MVLGLLVLFGLGTMPATSFYVAGGTAWYAVATHVFGYLLLAALLAVFLWQTLYGRKFHRGRLYETFEMLDKYPSSSTLPPIPAKDDASPLGLQAASQHIYTPQPPQGYTYTAYPAPTPPPPPQPQGYPYTSYV
jgi:hypothetical protein